MADEVFNSFTALRGRDERLQALEQIVLVLSLAERKAVEAAISRRNDIVGCLPFELALIVFGYLPPLDTWRLRLVSRAWNTLLSTNDFQQLAISRWSTHRDEDRVRTEHGRTLQDEVRHVAALHSGRPFYQQTLDPEDSDIRDVQLQGRYLVLRLRYHVTVRDLCSGNFRIYRDEARERIRHVVATSTAVAFTSDGGGHLYWIRLDGTERGDLQRVQLPSGNMAGIAGDGDWLVMLDPPEVSMTMLIFNVRTRQLRSVQPDLPRLSYNSGLRRTIRGMLVDSEREIVDVFVMYVSYEATLQRRLNYTRIRFDGTEMRSSGVLFLDQSTSDAHPELRLENTGHRNEWLVRVDQNSSTKWAALFDADEGKWTSPAAGWSLPVTSTNCVLWKGSVYCLAVSGLRPTFMDNESFWDTFDSEGRLIARYCRLSERVLHDRETLPSTEHTRLLMNETFLVALEPGTSRTRPEAMNVFCFDEDVWMRNSESTGFWKPRVSSS